MNDFLGWHWITKEEDCSAREEKYYFAKRSVGFEETTGMNYTWQNKVQQNSKFETLSHHKFKTFFSYMYIYGKKTN